MRRGRRRCRPGGSDRRRTAGTSGAMPRPVSRRRSRPRPSSLREPHAARAAVRRELDGVRQQVPDRPAAAAAGSPYTEPSASASATTRPGCPCASAAGWIAADCRVDDDRESHGLHIEPELAGDDARHVEQILDELRLRVGVPLDRLRARAALSRPDGARSAACASSRASAFSGVRSSCDSVARNSSFARLAAFALRVDARVLHRQRAPVGHILRELEIVRRCSAASTRR